MPQQGENICHYGKYLTGWTRHDSGGWNHQMAVISCALALSAWTNRSLVLPDFIHFPRGHTLTGKDESYPLRSCVDVELLALYNNTNIFLESEYKQIRSTMNQTTLSRYIPALLPKPDFKYCSHVTLLQQETCVYSHRSKFYYMFNYCQPSEYPACLHQPADFVRPAKHITQLVDRISLQLGEYIHLHVRRGDKGRGRETEVDNILKTLSHLGYAPNSNTTIWLGTDETAPDFFTALYASYRVATLNNFKFAPDVILELPFIGNIYANTHLANAKNHSLFSVQIDYLMSSNKNCKAKIDNGHLKQYFVN
eukprot:gene6047-12196_t